MLSGSFISSFGEKLKVVYADLPKAAIKYQSLIPRIETVTWLFQAKIEEVSENVTSMSKQASIDDIPYGLLKFCINVGIR